MWYKKKLSEKLTPDARSILEENMSEKAKSVRIFSYGSNMNENKFRGDMKSKIGLINKTKATLNDFKRTLNNDSERHGVAFSICSSPGSKVEGICHDIPIELLEDFLRKEGVLKMDNPSYRLIKVSIPNQCEPILTLLGLKPISLNALRLRKAKLALKYVKESIEGAEFCNVEHSDMVEMKKKLEDLIRTKKNKKMNNCPFCRYQNNGRKLDYDNKYFYLVVPREPAMYGHVLVVSKNQNDKHAEDIADPRLSQEQLKSMIIATQLLSRWMKKELKYQGKRIEKVYVLTQCETPHFHFHLKPRYENEDSGDLFLCFKELEELSWCTENSQSAEKNREGLKRLQEIELGLCKHKTMLNLGQWARENPEREKFVEKIEKKVNDLINKHRPELDAIKEKT